jgi:16S rRNA (guanine527-N7)-methyltransferase
MQHTPDDNLGDLAAGARAFGIALDAAQLAAFARLRALLLDWNQRINLTSITDPAEVVTRHFLDSLSVALALPPERRAGRLALLDVGSGAGFPGLPLAIAFPAWRVTLLEATGKKVRFLEHAIAELGLAHTRAVPGRAEEAAHTAAERGRYDVVAARALAPLPTLLEYCQPFARVGGLTVALKKGDLAAELAAGRRAAGLLGGALDAPVPVALPGLDDGRVLVVVRQVRACPPTYPRAAGAPVKRPLGAVE